MKKIEAIINSMTKKERNDHTIINGSRRKRIAIGSGTTVTDVNRLLKQYLEMRKMMKMMKLLTRMEMIVMTEMEGGDVFGVLPRLTPERKIS